MSTILRGLFVLIALWLSIGAHAGDASIEQQVESSVKKLNAYSRDQLESLQGRTADEYANDYSEAVDLIQKVGNSDLSEAKKVDLIADLSAAAGKSLQKFSEPYENPSPQISANTPVGAILGKVAYFATSVLRDLARSVGFSVEQMKFVGLQYIPIPGVSGNDEKRTAAMQKIGKAWVNAIDTEIEAYKKAADKGNPVAVAGLKHLVDSSKNVESVREGRIHEAAYRFLKFGLAPFMFLNPTLVPFEMTTYAPLVAGTMWSGVSLYLARVRRMNSGLDLYKAFKKFQSRVKKAELSANVESCEAILRGRSANKAPAQEEPVTKGQVGETPDVPTQANVPGRVIVSEPKRGPNYVTSNEYLKSIEQYRGTPEWNKRIKNCYDHCVIEQQKYFAEAMELAAASTEVKMAQWIVRDLAARNKWNVRPDIIADIVSKAASSAEMRDAVLKAYVETHWNHPNASERDAIRPKLQKLKREFSL